MGMQYEWSSRLVVCKVLHAVGQVLHRFPRIVGLALPPHQLMSAVTTGYEVQDLFHLIFAFLS